MNSVRFGGGPNYVMSKRPGQLVVNRIKDAIHFYMIGIGALPFAAVVLFQHIFYGTRVDPLESILNYQVVGPVHLSLTRP